METESDVFGEASNLSEARKNLETAKADLELSPTYHNGLRVQKHQVVYDKFIREARDLLLMVEGSNRFHTLTPLEIQTSALKELVVRCREMHEQHGHLFGLWGSEYAPFQYLSKVAQEALKDTGNG